MQAQIQALLVVMGGREATERPNSEANMEVAKPPIFSREARNIAGFITVYKLFLRIKIRGVVVEEQIQWILLYVQREPADIQKKNVLEGLELEEAEFKLVREFLLELKKEFGGGNEESVKVAELKRVK